MRLDPFKRRTGALPPGGDESGPFAAACDQGLVRHTNQDKALATAMASGWVLLAVADGVGGAPGGEVASGRAAETIEYVLRAHPINDPGKDLLNAFAEAHMRVSVMAMVDEEHPNMSTTLVAALVDETGRAWVVNVGDSRAYMLEKGGLRQITEDDSWVAERVRSGAMTEAEAEESAYKNVITRAIGAEGAVDKALAIEVQIDPGGALLLCSDGLYRMLSDGEIAALLGEAEPLQTIAQRLVELANAAGGVDNIGVAIYRA